MVNTDTSLDTFNEKDQSNLDVQKILAQPYKYGFTTDIEVEDFPKGINDDVIKVNFIEEKRTSIYAGLQIEGFCILAKDDCSYMGISSLHRY